MPDVMKVAFLTYSKAPELTISERRLIPELTLYGIDAEPVIWNSSNIQWKKYDALIFRSTWDYYLAPNVFTEWLKFMEDLDLKVYNPLQVIRKNMHKFYLRDMEQSGIRIVPSIFVPSNSDVDLTSLIPKAWKNVVIKPRCFGGIFLTTLFNIDQIDDIKKTTPRFQLKET
ncbi:MAG: hypothetical protein IPO92_14355 [Saprospiraceae bacterium]|nr:hypothetical protein [Saprospiraceae bacterium]